MGDFSLPVLPLGLPKPTPQPLPKLSLESVLNGGRLPAERLHGSLQAPSMQCFASSLLTEELKFEWVPFYFSMQEEKPFLWDF